MAQLDDLIANLAQECDKVTVPDDSSMKELSELVDTQLKLEDTVDKAENIVSMLKRKLTDVQERLIPDKMSELGCESITTADGRTVEIKPYYSGKIDKDNPEPAFKWLRERGFDGIIKNEVVAQFSKGEDAKARELYNMLASQGMNANQKESVHGSTLKAFIKEQVEKGNPPPKELFNTHVGQKAKIK